MTDSGTTDTIDEPMKGTSKPGSWGDLFGPGRATPAVVLASGVAMYALTVFVTAALMPSIVADIGGDRYYAWVTTAFLIPSVIASMQVSRLLSRLGASGSYAVAFGLFAVGSLVIAASPVMELLLVGRFVQGFGGGLLAGLGYAVIRAALPERLWTRAAGLVSAMWGVGTLGGPALGGVFANLGWWRHPFVLLMLLSILLGYLGVRALPRDGDRTAARTPMPVGALVSLTSASAAFSVTSILPQGMWTIVGLIAGVALIVGFVLIERRGQTTVLPRLTYQRGNPLKWIYLVLAALCAAVMTEMFIPLFGQELGNLNPLMAGFLGATISIGWTVTQLFSVNLTSDTAKRAAIRLGPLAVVAGLIAYGLMQTTDASVITVVGWSLVLIVAGAGIGVAFPHLSVAAMSSTDDEEEGNKAAAGVGTTELIANAVASAVAGILVSLGEPSMLASARYLAFGIAVIAVLGAVAARFASRR